jgi:hypothetical protein
MQMNTHLLRDIARWGGRITGLLFFLFIAILVVGHAFSPEGLPNPLRAGTAVQLEFSALFLMVVGGLVGWKSPPAATITIVLGYVLFRLVEGGLPWPPSAFEIPLVIACLYAIAWWTPKRSASPRPHATS